MGTDASTAGTKTLEPSEKAFSYADDKLSEPAAAPDASALARTKSRSRKASGQSRCSSSPLFTLMMRVCLLKALG